MKFDHDPGPLEPIMTKIKIHLPMLYCVLLLLVAGTAHAQTGELVPYQEGLHYFEIDQAPVASEGMRP